MFRGLSFGRMLNIGTRFCQQLTSRGFHAVAPIKQFTLSSCPAPSPPFLKPSALPSLIQSAGFKVKGRLRKRCKDCYFVMRQERLYVICKTHRRHKQMSMKPRPYKSWILTHATQSKIRPY